MQTRRLFNAALLGGTALGLTMLGAGPAAAQPQNAKVVPSQDNVTLEVSGHVHEAFIFADNDEVSDFTVGAPNTSFTRARFVGNYRVNEDFGIQTDIEINFASNRTDGGDFLFNNETGRNTSQFATERLATVRFKSKRFGTFAIGQEHEVGDGKGEFDLSGTFIGVAPDPELIAGDLNFATGAGADAGFGIDDLTFTGDLGRKDMVRYDTPRVFGLRGSAAFHDGGAWEVGGDYAADYKGTAAGDFKVIASVFFFDGESSDGGDIGGRTSMRQQVAGSASILHSSGFSISGGGNRLEFDELGANVDDHTTFWVKPGYQFKASRLGKTGIAFVYNRGDGEVGGTPNSGSGLTQAQVNDAEMSTFGAGVLQKIDAAATEIYLTGWVFDPDVPGQDIENIKMVTAGVRTKF